MAAPNLTVLTGAVDFSSAVAAVLSVAAALIVVYIAWKAAKMVIASVRGGSPWEGDDDGFSSDDFSAEDVARWEAERAERLRAAGFGKFV